MSANQGRLLNQKIAELEDLKTSVSNGKTLLANAITDKGVSASQNDSFATLANKISQISTAPTVVGSGSFSVYGGHSGTDTITETIPACDYVELDIRAGSGYIPGKTSGICAAGGSITLSIGRNTEYSNTGVSGTFQLSSDGRLLSLTYSDVHLPTYTGSTVTWVAWG